MRDIRKMTQVTMLISISILFHILESMVYLPIPIPGFKLGLANIVGLVALYHYGVHTMIQVNLFRVLLASLLRGLLFGTAFWLSLCGVLCSMIAAIIAYKKTPMSFYGVSVASSVFHVIGQMIAVSFLYQQLLMGYLLPILMLLAIPTGIGVAYIGKEVQKRLAIY